MAGKTHTKQPISMRLVQNQIPGEKETEASKERDYQNFRNRAKTKSDHRWRDLRDKPILLRLYFVGSGFDSTQEMLVEVGSFKPLTAPDGEQKNQEIGFEIRVKSPMTHGRSHRLEVLRGPGKATLFIQI